MADFERRVAQFVADSPSIVGLMAVGSQPESYRDLLAVSSLPTDEARLALGDDLLAKGVPNTLNEDAVIVGLATAGQLGVAVHGYADFFAGVDGILKGESVEPVYTNWSVGPWLPEAYAADIAGGSVLYDRGGELRDAQQRLVQYPEPLRTAIMGHAQSVLQNKLRASRQLAWCDTLGHMLVKGDMATAAIRHEYASNRVYLRRLSDVEKRAFDCLPAEAARSLIHTIHLINKGMFESLPE